MYFRELKQNYPVFVFDKNKVEVQTIKVQTIGIPHFDSHYNNNSMVVDITLDNGASYIMKSDSEVAYVNGLTISPNKEIVLRDIEATKSQSEQIVATVDRHKDIISKCATLLTELDPSIKEKAATEERMSKMEQSIGEMKDMFMNFINQQKNETKGYDREGSQVK